ncbi:MAG: hypothetical protein P4L51_05105 [Puia sp.]|nr:hypothetical protein [Puia sp.]
MPTRSVSRSAFFKSPGIPSTGIGVPSALYTLREKRIGILSILPVYYKEIIKECGYFKTYTRQGVTSGKVSKNKSSGNKQ